MSKQYDLTKSLLGSDEFMPSPNLPASYVTPERASDEVRNLNQEPVPINTFEYFAVLSNETRPAMHMFSDIPSVDQENSIFPRFDLFDLHAALTAEGSSRYPRDFMLDGSNPGCADEIIPWHLLQSHVFQPEVLDDEVPLCFDFGNFEPGKNDAAQSSPAPYQYTDGLLVPFLSKESISSEPRAQPASDKPTRIIIDLTAESDATEAPPSATSRNRRLLPERPQPLKAARPSVSLKRKRHDLATPSPKRQRKGVEVSIGTTRVWLQHEGAPEALACYGWLQTAEQQFLPASLKSAPLYRGWSRKGTTESIKLGFRC
ncbi:hypothetical protein DL771_009391 [Monosporascus sp. 5C6A]|nr:hypothetical protein DL771_009391 [Monosporascus sp. 5C6A]